MKRLKKWLLRGGAGALALGLALWALGSVMLKRWTQQPPPLPADTAIMALKPEQRGDNRWLGKSWAGRREGLLVVHLKGSPFEIGYADGLLMQKQMHTLETEFIEMIQQWVPRRWVMKTLKNYVIYRNRHLSEYVPLEYRQELYGTSLGCADIRPEEGSFYNRLLNYHAAHDVSYMMIDNPLVARAGCTAFGAWGGATTNGHLLAARNFDWEAAEVFSRDRVVMMCEPDGGIPFISLSWAGMLGVVSGMNRAGVSVSINGAPSDLPRETALPLAIAAREILQKARNLEESLAILRSAKVFVSSLWLVGSRADGKFVIVEKTPDEMVVREAEGETIICANHFEGPGLRENARNQQHQAESTSVSRQARMTELLKAAHGQVDPARAADILRDRKLPGGQFAGNDHRATLNAFIATHATIMDLTEGIFWAASPPNQLGKFVAFDLNDFERELPARTLAADSVVASGEFENARAAKKALTEGHAALKAKQPELALELGDKAVKLNPGFYQNHTLRGRALQALGKHSEAATAFAAALAGEPAFLSERLELEKWLKEVTAP